LVLSAEVREVRIVGIVGGVRIAGTVGVSGSTGWIRGIRFKSAELTAADSVNNIT
jgi:hypothetical protein